MKHALRHAVLSATATFDDEDGALRAIIETPHGSANKYDYNPDCDCFELATTLPEGMTFPFDYGFVPSTTGDDGDPLDIIVLSDAPVMSGCLIRTKLIGSIGAQQKDEGKKWEQNDRLVAVAVHARSHDHICNLKELSPDKLKEVKAFFVQYNKLHAKKFRPTFDSGPEEALKLVETGMRKYRKQKKT